MSFNPVIEDTKRTSNVSWNQPVAKLSLQLVFHPKLMLLVGNQAEKPLNRTACSTLIIAIHRVHYNKHSLHYKLLPLLNKTFCKVL